MPLRLSKGYNWPGNGTILARHDPYMRMVIFEDGYYPSIWSELENRLGLSISDAMIRGQQASTWEYMENNILYGGRKYLLHRLPVNLLIKRIINETSLFGFGKVSVVKYERGKLLVMKVKYPFDIISVVWGVKGIFELVEGVAADLAWHEEGDEYTISVTQKAGSKPHENIDRSAIKAMKDARSELSFDGQYLAPQGERCSRCSLCGVPSGVEELEWREDEGGIYSRITGRRFIYTSGHIFVGVVRDLEARTGRELGSFILEATKFWQLRELQKTRVVPQPDAYDRMAKQLLAFGFGNVWDLSYGEGHLEITIANPLYVPRVVGRIAGLFEYVEGREAEINFYSPEPRLVKVEVKTA
ncbi:MAG: hypothetical protein A2W01_01630 [Candidatus Solincola sediminis]|uniref:Uncharacterized protein n=1 Tax=Candidatus Solincola sediminis TaxID=1797199 RepID=A0A1F2WKC1_9ACTN|nr:MAG: hypothetical protein A2Y75_07680 [Candidatus Solincola sediminis]OFW58804.1 MAG: hypothetical protein A2W01_01630 [Candidatus Solincola sediminis]